ncbi:MAG TPA: diguanylate cyclase [Kofleriaceae bacterium]|nr:diguanylate cyclase [Kofleriaceae bacterium]
MRGEVVNAGATASQLYLVARDADELVATIEASHPRAVIVDREYGEAEDVLRRLAEVSSLPDREDTTVFLVIRDTTQEPPAGADVVVLEPVLRHALMLADRTIAVQDRRPLALDRLLTISVLSGALDDALETAASQVAIGFGVDRCVISVRGDSTGGAAVGAHTWDSLTWNQTADYCRIATSSGATLIAPSPTKGAICESYLSVPLETPLGSHGFIGLVISRPRIFTREHRVVLQAVASRLGTELGWRAVHQRTADELDRVVNGPGLDQLLGIWNRTAMTQLATMHVSASVRSGIPLTVVVVDVLDLGGINTRHGLGIGDRLLRHIADALRANVRTEDVVGRWSGDKIAVLLPGTALDGAQRVAERFRNAIAERPIELPAGGALRIPANVGLAALQKNEEAGMLFTRAAHAAKKARDADRPIARASTGPAPRLSTQPMDVVEDLRATLGGAYRLLHEISRGGMGVVYRAEDLALERPVAIKMLRPDLAEDRAFVEHLRVEAAMLARLEHPNLVQIFNFGQSGGDSYFVMELLEGEGLQQAVERHRIEGTMMPIPELVTAIDQVASALDALHERGIIHRDVKPANVIRDPFRSRSVLVDVGIARRYGQFAESAGTPGYVAPEVIEGHEATARSDVYGLAATTYTLLTLTAPWGDGDGVLQRQTTGEDLVPPSVMRAELAPADELLTRALSRDPTHRPPSAGAFARDLHAALLALAPIPKPDGARWVANTVMPGRSTAVPKTRGVVFRSVTRALGVRDAERLRDALGRDHAELSRALSDTAPLAWLPTELFERLLTVAPAHVDRDSSRLARDIARATVRASFRRFFPASAATLVPERTLSAIRNVWSRYQSWGNVSSMPIHASETVVRITGTPKNPDLCVWTAGLLEQLVVLSGGRGAVAIDHEACEARGDEACIFRAMWGRPEQ